MPKSISIDDWVLQRALGFIGVKATPQIKCLVGGALLPQQPTVQVEDPGADGDSEFHLWGITYRVNCRQRVRALVLLLEPHERNTRKLDWIYYRVEGMYWFSSPFLTFSELFLLIESAKRKHIYLTAGLGLLSVVSGGVITYSLIKPRL
jgi:hypothetical protein